DRRGVRVAVVGDSVRCDHDDCIGLVDDILDSGVGDVVVVGGAGETPRVAAVGCGSSVCRVQSNRANRGPALAIHTCDRSDASCVGVAVIRNGVWRNHYHGVGLVDGVGDGRGGDVVVIRRASEAPIIGV